MLILISSAAWAGFVHSLAPGHWLPIVLLAKARKWSPLKAGAAALVTASGHIVLSLSIITIALAAGSSLLHEYEHVIESYAGLGLAAFGIGYAIFRFGPWWV